MIIIGLDPSTTQFGVGVIEQHNDKVKYINAYSYHLDKQPVYKFVVRIQVLISELIESYLPRKICIEKMFINRSNRHMALLNIIPRIIEDVIKEYNQKDSDIILPITMIMIANTTIKKNIGGHGRAEKDTVAKGVFDRLGINKNHIKGLNGVKNNATDALAVALSHDVNPRKESLPK